jgi:hypothetical protein
VWSHGGVRSRSPGVTSPAEPIGAPGTQPGERGRRLEVALAGGSALLLALCLFLAPEASVLGLASDDAFYYFEIARSIAAGHGSRFDGIAVTNGYHPLWMLCAVLAYVLVPGDPLIPAAWLIWLGAVFGLCTLVAVRRMVDSAIAPGFGVVAAALLLLPNTLTAMVNGMETGLALASAAAVLAFCYHRRVLERDSSLSSVAWLGVLLGVAFLARLDSVFLGIAAGALLLLGGVAGRAPWRDLLLRCVALAAGFCVLAVPYLVWNQATFGSPMPISGAVKSSLPEIRRSLALEGDSDFGLALLIAGLLALGLGLALDLRRGRSVLTSPLVLLALACVGHFLHVYLFMSWGVYWWHFLLYGVLFALAVPAALARVVAPERTRVVAFACAAATAVVAGYFQIEQFSNKSERHAAWRDAALWARANTAPEVVFALKDAGLFAFFSDRRVINLDGKANGLLYREHLARGQVEEYLREVGVSYVADINGGCTGEGLCSVKILRPNRPGIFLRLAESDEVYRSVPYSSRFADSDDTAGLRQFAIWRFPSRSSGAKP